MLPVQVNPASSIQTPEHILQDCPAYQDLRRQTWLEEVDSSPGEAVGISSSTEKDCRLDPQEWTDDLSMVWKCRRRRVRALKAWLTGCVDIRVIESRQWLTDWGFSVLMVHKGLTASSEWMMTVSVFSWVVQCKQWATDNDVSAITQPGAPQARHGQYDRVLPLRQTWALVSTKFAYCYMNAHNWSATFR